MTIEEATEYFGSGYRICKLLGIRMQNYTNWRKDGCIPLKSQIKLEEISEGEIQASIDDYRTKVNNANGRRERA